MKKTKWSLKAFILHVIESSNKTLQLSLNTRWQTSFELFSLTRKWFSTGWRAHWRSAQKRKEFYLGRWQLTDVCFFSLQHAWCKHCSWSSPPGGEIHLKFGLRVTIKTPNSVPKFKLAWNLSAAPGWLVCLLLPLLVMWYSASKAVVTFVFACWFHILGGSEQKECECVPSIYCKRP